MSIDEEFYGVIEDVNDFKYFFPLRTKRWENDLSGGVSPSEFPTGPLYFYPNLEFLFIELFEASNKSAFEEFT
jgi:hypothetical protein